MWVSRRCAEVEQTDADLVVASAAGSAAAFSELYRRHAPGVARAIAGHVGDRERQRDLLQETFTRAFTKIVSLREPERFRQWVLQIARNAATDDLRSRARTPVEVLDEERVAGVTDDPELVVHMRWMAMTIEAGLASLSPRDAAALSMTVHLGFGPAEVAAALGISHGNAKVVVHRARQRLREAMQLEAPATTRSAGPA
jgi:RNA polymerase sigma factor (sigma-70 family)